MQPQAPKPAAPPSDGRLRYLLLGLIIGASTIVLLTSNGEPLFGTAAVVDKAMPSAPSIPSALASVAQRIAPPAESSRIPEIDVSRLPKAAPESSAAPATAKSGKAKGKKDGAEGEDKKAVRGPAPAEESASGMPAGLEQVMESMQSVTKAFGAAE